MRPFCMSPNVVCSRHTFVHEPSCCSVELFATGCEAVEDSHVQTKIAKIPRLELMLIISSMMACTYPLMTFMCPLLYFNNLECDWRWSVSAQMVGISKDQQYIHTYITSDFINIGSHFNVKYPYQGWHFCQQQLVFAICRFKPVLNNLFFDCVLQMATFKCTVMTEEGPITAYCFSQKIGK